MNNFSVSFNLKNFNKTIVEIQELEQYQVLGYVPVKYENEKFLTNQEKNYKKIFVGNQKYFLQPPN
jgi:hypothetical protein|tara:strand:+ start:428 stop:625 length:198 start_codon:yes stop_codon:yes gene_type:complete